MILENGTIRTLDPQLPTARALAIAGDRIAGGVGTHELALPTPERVDLGGRCVVPGFNDAHVHFLTWALARRRPRLEGCRSLAETVERIARAAESASRDRWLVGLGWTSGGWREAREPTRHDLDPVTGELPVAVWSRDGHALLLNTAALARARDDLAAPGGIVEVDTAGMPTGILREHAAWRFGERYLAPSEDEAVEALREAIAVAHARGVTAIHDMDGATGSLAAWQRLHTTLGLTLRVWQVLPWDRLEELEGLGLRTGFGDAYLRLGHLKVFLDGTLGSGSAALLDGSGTVLMARAELAELARRAARAGWPLAVHAIGDRANRNALEALAEARAEWAPAGLRPRIEHAQLVDLSDLGRFAALGVACSVQCSHAPADRDLADALWPAGRAGAYAYRALWDSGALLADGSDAPVEELDPLRGIRAAVLRTLDERRPWRPEQALTVEEALRAATVNAAWLCGEERQRGTLVPGRLADLVVLDRDPVACSPAELAGTRVVATMVGGRWVFNPPPWDAEEESR